MKLRRLAGGIFVVAAFAYLIGFIYQNAEQLRTQEWTIRPGLLIASLLVQIVGLFWGVGVWKLLLRVMGNPVPFRQVARIWFVSGLGRYIPGKVWQFVGAAHIGRASGLAAVTTITALAAHTIFFLIGAAFVSVYFVPQALGVSPSSVTLIRWLTPLLFLLVHPAVIRTALHVLRRLTRKDLLEWTGGWSSGAALVLLSVAGWLITGGAFFVFVSSFTELPLETLPTVAGINAFSFIVGTLFFPAPAGFGAKEVALTTMLTGYVTAPAAAIIAVAARLWTIAAEVIPALVLLPRGSAAAAGDSTTRESDS